MENTINQGESQEAEQNNWIVEKLGFEKYLIFDF